MHYHYLRGRDAIYTEQMLCDVVGSIDLAIVGRALETLIHAHDALRTVLMPDDEGGTGQVVRDFSPSAVRFTDLSGHPSSTAFLRSRIRRELARGFDLSQETTRCELFRLTPDRHFFLWTYHHLIMDALSIRLLQSQFCSAYHALAEGGESPVVTAPPYRAYVEWVREQPAAEAMRYWLDYLRDADVTPRLRLIESGAEPTTTRVVFREQTTGLMQRIARHLKTTVIAVFLTAWGTYLLNRFDRDRIVFGCVVSGRMIRLHDVNKICGLLVNAIPIRLNESERIGEAIPNLSRHLFRGGSYAYLALNDIMRCGGLDPEDLVTVVNFSVDDVRIEGRADAPLPFTIENIRYNERAHYPVYLDVYLNDRDLTVAVHHDPARFTVDPAAIEQHLSTIFTAFATDSDWRLGEATAKQFGEKSSSGTVFNF